MCVCDSCLLTDNINWYLFPGYRLNSLRAELFLDCRHISSMAQCKNAVILLLTHWSYCRLALSHRIVERWQVIIGFGNGVALNKRQAVNVTNELPVILWMRPANERRRYIVLSYLIGWAHSQKDPAHHETKQARVWNNCPPLSFLICFPSR